MKQGTNHEELSAGAVYYAVNVVLPTFEYGHIPQKGPVTQDCFC